MQLAPFVFAVMVGVPCAASPAFAQENVGKVEQPQTTAPRIDIPGGQPASCGPAPPADQLNLAAQQALRTVANRADFKANWTRIANGACPRNQAARYLIHVISANHWSFVPNGAPLPDRPPSSLTRCGVAADTSEMNYVIGQIRPLFPDPVTFNANIKSINAGPCIASRATIYLVSLMALNRWSFRR